MADRNHLPRSGRTAEILLAVSKPELAFRRKLLADMRPYWHATIHVENRLNPGVPDLSFLMHGNKCETGWLELKVAPGFSVEPGQHEWMARHAAAIPAFFLIQVGQYAVLVPGIEHSKLITDPAQLLFKYEAYDNAMALAVRLRRATIRSRYE